eukprot:scaffold1097_cov246-Pinguiococcus_pyrenoidosus.AAC.8
MTSSEAEAQRTTKSKSGKAANKGPGTRRCNFSSLATRRCLEAAFPQPLAFFFCTTLRLQGKGRIVVIVRALHCCAGESRAARPGSVHSAKRQTFPGIFVVSRGRWHARPAKDRV